MSLARPLALLLAVACSRPGWSADVFQETLRSMRQLDAEITEPSRKAPLLEKALASLAPATSTGLGALSDDHVRDVYDAARMTAYYGYGVSAAAQMRRAWDELDRRHIAPAGSADEVIETYLAARLFDEAQAFQRAHPAAVRVPPPAFTDLRSRTHEPTVLAVVDDGSRLQRRPFSPTDKTRVVIVGSPWCQFSNAAAAEIESDPALKSLLGQHATWLIPQQIVHDVRAVARWNHDHPANAMSLIYRQSEWPFIHTTATPTFYFFRDGTLVSSFSGWPGAAQKKVLSDNLRGIGLSAEDAAP